MHKWARFTLPRLGLLLVIVFVQLLAPPAAASATDAAWHAEYFANQDLAGTPAAVRDQQELNFNWGWGSPGSGLPTDHFSARWTRKIDFPAGQFRFSAAVDDGVRVYVDGQKVIDQWHVTAPITYASSLALAAGTHTITVEYFESTERAQIHVWWDQNTIIPVNPTTWQPPSQAGAWRGSYYNNADLDGDPEFERDDALIYFNWDYGSPGAGVSNDWFSVRWQRTVNLEGGTYVFRVTADDGVRVWYDWQLLIDEWHRADAKTYEAEKYVKAGTHEIVIEYFDSEAEAEIQFEWEDTRVSWIGNLFTCVNGSDSWVKIYRLGPTTVWEDTRPDGYGPQTPGGELKLFGMPISPLYGWDGQPYKVELYVSGKLVRTEGDVLAGQPALLLRPGSTIQTSWPCGPALPRS